MIMSRSSRGSESSIVLVLVMSIVVFGKESVRSVRKNIVRQERLVR